MRWAAGIVAGIVLCFAASPLAADDPTFPERGRSAVVDAAGVIPDDVEAGLNTELVDWNRATGHQFVVATVPSLQGYEIEEYGYRLLRHWGLGRAGANDGVILLLARNERKVRIEVGYGLEPVLTDALSRQIIQQTIWPALQSGDVGGALSAGAERIMEAAVRDPADARAMTLAAERATRQSGPSIWLILLIGIPTLLVVGVTAIFFYEERRSARERRESQQRQARWERDAPNRERQKQARLKRRWDKLKEEGKTPFDKFEDFYSDHLDKQRAKEREKERQRLARHASDEPRGASSDSWAPWPSTSDYSEWEDDSSSSDPGFDSGGGSGGGGGADSDY